MPPKFASDRGQRVDIELVVPTAGDLSDVGLDFLAIGADAALGLPAVQPLASPVLGTFDTAADASPPLPAALPPTFLILGTSDTAADTSPPLLEVLPLTPLILGTSDMAVGASPPLTTVLPPIPPILGTSDMAADASPPLPAVLPPILGTSDMAADTSPPFPVVLSPTKIIEDSHKDVDAFITGTFDGHSSEKSMSWQDWENSFTAFRALFDGGVTILRSIDELLPLYHKFNGYVAFQGALVYPKTVAVLRKFMDKYGSFMEASDITYSFSRCVAFRALGLVLHGIGTMQLLDIIDHKLFCWQDAICEAITLGFHMDFLLNLVKDLACRLRSAGHS
ncbi:unnamed protein product [Prunus armeniaca]